MAQALMSRDLEERAQTLKVIQFKSDRNMGEETEYECLRRENEKLRQQNEELKKSAKPKKQKEERPPAQPRKDGQKKNTHSNKEKGKKSEVYCLQIEDMQKIVTYFRENEKWTHYLAFVLSINLARRCGDILAFKWKVFFNPATGKLRNETDAFEEQKTGKISVLYLNSAVKDAINLYIEKVGCDPSEDNYEKEVFYQHTGTHKGKPMSYGAYYKALKEASEKLEIPYNIGTHSPRKTFGYLSRMIHPNDQDSMIILQEIFRHSDSKTTNRYIGITREREAGYFQDLGNFFGKYVIDGEEYKEVANKPIISLDVNDLRAVINLAYETGLENHGKSTSVHLAAVSSIMEEVEELMK